MSHFRDPAGSRPQDRVVVDIIEGRPWNARHVRNNCLRQHCRVLTKTFERPHTLTDPLRPTARKLIGHISRSSNLLTRVHPKELQVVPALVRMAAYHGKWIRDPADWKPDPSRDPRHQLYDLAAHLFAPWPMPEWFGSAWLVKGNLFYLERDWYCHVAAGGSLRKAVGMPSSFTHRALHLARHAPGHLTVREALRWGQVKSLGGSGTLLHQVLKSRMLGDLSEDAAWSRLMEKLNAAKYFDLRNFGIIADMLIEVIRRDGWHRAGDLLGLPVTELLGHSRRYWRAVFAAGLGSLPEMKRLDIRDAHARAHFSILVSRRWTRMHRVSDFHISRDKGDIWLIEELTCHAQLLEEGRAMSHCVSGYGKRCTAGRSSVFRLRNRVDGQADTREVGNLTIEVDRQSRRILQIRGKSNRWATAEELKVVRRWASGSGLLIA